LCGLSGLSALVYMMRFSRSWNVMCVIVGLMTYFLKPRLIGKLRTLAHEF
jgi:lipid-A-disaccharide synthase-like uncharacterized protein